MLFAAVFGAPACCIPLNGYVSFISRPRKFLSVSRGCYKDNLSLFPVPA